MIYNFSIPTPEDTTDFSKLPIKPIDDQVIEILKSATESRNKFRIVLKEMFLKNLSFGESFLQYKDIAENYLIKNIDVVLIYLIPILRVILFR